MSGQSIAVKSLKAAHDDRALMGSPNASPPQSLAVELMNMAQVSTIALLALLDAQCI